MRFIAVIAAILFPLGAIAMEPTYTELDAGWKVELEAKRNFVAKLAKAQFGYTLSGTPKDLPILQRIVDAGLIPVGPEPGYQALGVVFGDATAAELDAEWKQVKDEYGEGPVLKIRNRRAAIGALTIISKRMEDNGTVNIMALHDNLVRDVAGMRAEMGKDGH